MKKLFFVFILMCVACASCGKTYKVKFIRSNNVLVLHGLEEGYVKGDTIVYEGCRVVIDSVME